MGDDRCAKLFLREQANDVFIVTPIHNLGDFDLLEVSSSCDTIVDEFRERGCRHVLLDLGQIDIFGSAAIGLFLRLWKRVRDTEGMMLVCNASPQERNVLRHTRLDTLWPVVGSREDAMDHIRQTGRAGKESH